MKVAVVADVHLHDLYGGYGWLEEGSGDIALRTLKDTMASTRVFNESYSAFLAVLDDIVRRDIRDVVLLGDYSDDGQPSAVAALKKILFSYEATHGLRFFATFGNHDCFGPTQQHQAKWMTKADGLNPVLVTSDESAPSPAVVHSDMMGMSTAQVRSAMAAYGFDRPQGVFHWETPFGDKVGPDLFIADTGDTRATDVSYLVEPQLGLWLLILDANVFEKFDGKWRVRADAAWDHVLRQRPYILDWITDVSARAERLGKTLLTFSHYPALPLTLIRDGNDFRQRGTPDWLKRMPSVKSGELLAKAGMRWHFSGHMHVAKEVKFGGLVNIAVPSPVAYPGGYVEITCENNEVEYKFVRLGPTPGFDVAFVAYQKQHGRNGPDDQWTDALGAETFAEFLQAHLVALVKRRHIPSDWPPEMHSILGTLIAELFSSVRESAEVASHIKADSASLQQMLLDYYFLRANEPGAIPDISADRKELYRRLADIVSPCHKFEQLKDQIELLLTLSSPQIDELQTYKQ